MILYIILGIFICLCVGYVLWQHFELKKFNVTEYEIATDKLQTEIRLAVLADLHGFEYGDKNERLLAEIRQIRPDYILIAGDMIVSKYPKTYEPALETIRELVEIAPVYYSFGNHESKANRKKLAVYKDFQNYLKEVQALGVQILRNENRNLQRGEEEIALGGIEISLDYYEKGHIVPMDKEYVGRVMREAPKGCFQILLAHNPMYSEQYAHWGADLTFCGHNHGGLVRIPGIGSLMSPQLTFFPKYSEGMHKIGGRSVIISRGLGTHTFHVRIFNRAELLQVRLFPKFLEKSSLNG